VDSGEVWLLNKAERTSVLPRTTSSNLPRRMLLDNVAERKIETASVNVVLFSEIIDELSIQEGENVDALSHLVQQKVVTSRLFTHLGKSWSLRKEFSRPGKSRKMTVVMESHGTHGKVVEFHQ